MTFPGDLQRRKILSEVMDKLFMPPINGTFADQPNLPNLTKRNPSDKVNLGFVAFVEV